MFNVGSKGLAIFRSRNKNNARIYSTSPFLFSSDVILKSEHFYLLEHAATVHKQVTKRQKCFGHVKGAQA
jgi:hypothetical protein